MEVDKKSIPEKKETIKGIIYKLEPSNPMAQKFVMKNRSKDSDGKKEMSHMIRDPRQRTLSKHSGPQSHDLYNRHYVRLNSNKQGKIVVLDDKDVSSRIKRKASIAAKKALMSEKKPSKSSCKALVVKNQFS